MFTLIGMKIITIIYSKSFLIKNYVFTCSFHSYQGSVGYSRNGPLKCYVELGLQAFLLKGPYTLERQNYSAWETLKPTHCFTYLSAETWTFVACAKKNRLKETFLLNTQNKTYMPTMITILHSKSSRI